MLAPRDPGDRPRPRRARRGGPTAHWAMVVTLLVVTFGAMLFSIYWVVKTAKQ